jgi:cytochrome oxidase Cu insertion factor (SCO1/SenC/PrrC family)
MNATSKQNKKFTLTLLTLIFVVPMLAAWLSASKGWFLSNNKVNHGTLLQPPLSIFTLDLRDDSGNQINNQLQGKWWLMYLTENPKTQLSLHNLYYLRQIRQATGKDRERIERAVITTQAQAGVSAWVAQKYPGTRHFIISSTKLGELESNLPKKLALQMGSLYLVDPLGNIMLFYTPNAAPKGILKDLQKVLKVSQIG